ncbi:FAD-binding and (Fe-S)-binding domain-containing protein [Pelagibacterium luteolum]|uniref:D-2-hydroxyglutarate dehydrogenase n=1 Tax=Pelagibacterium luteolum TaxID=440168 RepID=A0A1G7Z9U3_9HYPH|nr:FAD-binding and (Fe-S)-binding domain-containing protein [Pelagibacterium luteolum]SDH04870.1 FAD/FMN-containing dehydrogenase [Pelagibacterium luteolum]
MTPHLSRTQASLARYLQAVEDEGFTGSIETSFSAREVLATDNSIYRVRPSAVLFPTSTADIEAVGRALAQSGNDTPALVVRGGGTGTNGQSLTTGVVLDTSRHMRTILDFDAEKGVVSVEPGVVLDQLNAFLAPYGWFFPPMVSTSSRATIGGMVSTDASGKGSRQYGRTSDYIEALDLVLADGSAITIDNMDRAQTEATCRQDDRLGEIVRKVRAALEGSKDYFPAVFPKMNRGLTGYNLEQALRADGGLNLCKIIAGSEGTLALISKITLRLARKPAVSGILAVFYSDFTAALHHVPRLVEADPLAIEILDDKVLALAQTDPVWLELGALFGVLPSTVGAVNFVEVTGETFGEIENKLHWMTRHIEGDDAPTLIRAVTEPGAIRAAWSLRSKAVGLLGGLEGRRKAVPFVEDTAVPPEALAGYVAEFRALLDRHGIDYGMFGHADVGCLHVRPTLDMTDAADRLMIRTISDEVVALTRAYGGLLWGEHGRGVRGEYLEEIFGPELYPVVRGIKAVFDPGNRLNPGKLATPEGSPERVERIDEVPFRGALDETVSLPQQKQFASAIACNGNGACHDWDPDAPMCPSYKATRDKTQSPNGRAALFRAWAQKSNQQTEAALKESLETCLSCRACASACPVKVDIPTMKSRFLDAYYASHRRPLRDYGVRFMEPMLVLARRAPKLANKLLGSSLGKAATRAIGLLDIPLLAERSLDTQLRAARIGRLTRRSQTDAASVILVPDSFLASFDPGPIVAAARVLAVLGFKPLVADIMANGKGLEVRGFSKAYERVKNRHHAGLASYAERGIPIVGIEPATTIQVRNEGAHFLISIDRFLEAIDTRVTAKTLNSVRHTLLVHCTERTADPASGLRWARIMDRFGVTMAPRDVGCCGMSGLFGHEAEHAEMSKAIFDLSWTKALALGNVAATGFSCRCQTKRLASRSVPHPIEVLARAIAPEGDSNG